MPTTLIVAVETGFGEVRSEAVGRHRRAVSRVNGEAKPPRLNRALKSLPTSVWAARNIAEWFA
jgi:hypothetical protein